MSAPANSVDQVIHFLRSLKPRQQLLLALAAIVTLAAIWAFQFLLGKAEYRALYSDLAPAEAQNLAAKLQAQNIRHELAPDGRGIRVAADQLDQARLALAAQGLPATGRLGFELFDKPNWAGSSFSEKVNFQRALESELERTIGNIQEVESARVHLVLPRESLFAEQERPAKAAVVVKLRGGRLAGESVYAIRNLVAGAVEQMKPENVTVVNADGHTPLAAGAGPGARSQNGDALEKALEQKVRATLAPVLGEEKLRATVTIEYESASSESTQESYDPNSSVVLTSQQAEEQIGAPAIGGIPGTPSNVPNAAGATPAPPPVTLRQESQAQKSEAKTFGVNKTVRRMIEPAGRVRRLAMALLVDDATEAAVENGQRAEKSRRRSTEELAQITELAKAAVGFDEKRGDQFAIHNLSFRVPVLEQPAAPALPQRVLQVADRWIWLLRYAALALLFFVLYWVVFRPLKNQIIQSFQSMPAALAPAALPASLGTTLAPQPELAAPQAAELEAKLQQELAEGTSDVKRTVMLKRHLLEKIKKEPQGASRLIQNWIRREGARR